MTRACHRRHFVFLVVIEDNDEPPTHNHLLILISLIPKDNDEPLARCPLWILASSILEDDNEPPAYCPFLVFCSLGIDDDEPLVHHHFIFFISYKQQQGAGDLLFLN
jgi:hypothetical protein